MHLVYLAACKTCLCFYVGKTNKSLTDRIREHINDIKKGDVRSALFKHVRITDMNHSCQFLVLQLCKENKRQVTSKHKLNVWK